MGEIETGRDEKGIRLTIIPSVIGNAPLRVSFPRAKKKELRFVLKTQSKGERRTSRRSEYSLVRHKRLPTYTHTIPFSSSLPMGFPARPLKRRGVGGMSLRILLQRRRETLGCRAVGKLDACDAPDEHCQDPNPFSPASIAQIFFSFLPSAGSDNKTLSQSRVRGFGIVDQTSWQLPLFPSLADKQTSPPRTNGLN